MGRPPHTKKDLIFQEFKIIQYRLEYHLDLIKAFRRRFKLPENGLKQYYEDKTGRKKYFTRDEPRHDWEDKQTKKQLDKFDNEVSKLMANFKIPQRYWFYVRNWIQLSNGASNALFVEPRINANIGIDSNTNEKVLLLAIDADTTSDDFKDKNLWKRIEKLQTQLKEHDNSLKRNFIPNLEALKKIYDWHTVDKLSYKEINEKLPFEKIRKQNDFQSIGTLIRRYKDYIGVK